MLKEQIRNLAASEGIDVPESYVNKISKVLIARNKADWGKLNAVREFEGGMLTSMYQRVINAIREVDNDTFIFVEPFSVGVNNAEPTYLGHLQDPRGENNKRRLGYIPHMYPRDLDLYGRYGDGDFINIQQWQDNQKRYVKDNKMAWLVGEYGVSNGAEGGVAFLDDAVLMLERNQLGWLYWESYPGDWGPIAADMSDSKNAEAIVNIYPRAVAGNIHHYHFDRHNGVFSLLYSKSDAMGTTDIAIPPRFAASGFEVSSSDPDDRWQFEFDDQRYVLHIDADPGSVRHQVVIRLNSGSATGQFRELVEKRNDKCLDFRGVFPEEGSEIITWHCDRDHSWQRWAYQPDVQQLRSLQDSRFCVSHGGADQAVKEGAVFLSHCHDSDDLRWQWDNGVLRNVYDTSLVLDAFDDGVENGNGDGATVAQYPDNGGLNQQWRWGRY